MYDNTEIGVAITQNSPYRYVYICIKNVKQEYSALISIAICILMIISIVGRLSYIVEYLEIINEYLNRGVL